MDFLAVSADEMLHLSLGGVVADPLSPAALHESLAHPGGPAAVWARHLSGKIMQRAEKEGAPHSHYAGMLLSAILTCLAEIREQDEELSFRDVYFLAERADVQEENPDESPELDKVFDRFQKEDSGNPAARMYGAWQHVPGHERKASIGLLIGAILPLLEWEETNVECVTCMAVEETLRLRTDAADGDCSPGAIATRMRSAWERALGVIATRMCPARERALSDMEDGQWETPDRFNKNLSRNLPTTSGEECTLPCRFLVFFVSSATYYTRNIFLQDKSAAIILEETQCAT